MIFLQYCYNRIIFKGLYFTQAFCKKRVIKVNFASKKSIHENPSFCHQQY